MPGPFQNATPSTVMPSLCRAFVHTREYPEGPDIFAHAQARRLRLGLDRHYLGAVDLRAEGPARQCQ
jgi:hypothetical protein